MRNLADAVRGAVTTIERAPQIGVAAPSPYPDLARPGEAWLHVGRYWFAYTKRAQPEIITIFYDAADIPGRR